MLGYRGYYLRTPTDQERNAGLPKPTAKFLVRQAAAEGLKNMGEQVPEDLVFELELKPADAGGGK